MLDLRPEMSQRQIADLLGISRSAVQQYEASGLRKMRVQMERSAAARGLTVQEWLNGERPRREAI